MCEKWYAHRVHDNICSRLFDSVTVSNSELHHVTGLKAQTPYNILRGPRRKARHCIDWKPWIIDFMGFCYVDPKPSLRVKCPGTHHTVERLHVVTTNRIAFLFILMWLQGVSNRPGWSFRAVIFHNCSICVLNAGWRCSNWNLISLTMWPFPYNRAWILTHFHLVPWHSIPT